MACVDKQCLIAIGEVVAVATTATGDTHEFDHLAFRSPLLFVLTVWLEEISIGICCFRTLLLRLFFPLESVSSLLLHAPVYIRVRTDT